MKRSLPTRALHRGFRMGFVCPFCLAPLHNPGASDGRLSEPERRLLKKQKFLPRVCLVCGGVYSLVAGLCSVPGIPESVADFGDDYMPIDERGYRYLKDLPITKGRALSAWISEIRPMLKNLHEDGLTVNEIACKLGKPERRVRRWMQRAGLLKGKWAK